MGKTEEKLPGASLSGNRSASEGQKGGTAWKSFAGYALAVLGPVTILFVRLIVPFERGLFLTMILLSLQILLCAYLGGLGAGSLSTAIASLALDYFLLPPTHSFTIASAAQAAQWVWLIVAGAMLTLLGASLRRLVWLRRSGATGGLEGVALLTALVYGIVAAIWIGGSNKLLVTLVPDPEVIGHLATAKGWIFVALTSFLLYFGLRRQLRRWEREASARRFVDQERRKWADAFAHCSHGIAIDLPESTTIQTCNAAFAKMHGKTVEEISGHSALELFDPSARPSLQHAFDTSDREGQFQFEAIRLRKDGSTFPAQVDFVSVSDAGGHPLYRVATVEDITEQQTHKKEVERLNKIYATLSAINGVIARAQSPAELFQEICRVTVEHSGFKLVWVGLCDPATRSVSVAAHAGEDKGYLDQVRITYDEGPEGQGLAGTAIREGRSCISNDFATDPRLRPWRDSATAHGLLSVAAFPIRVKNQVCGAFTIYSGEPHAFQDREVALLEEAARDISFGLEHLQQEQKRIQAEQELRASEERFRQMAESIGEVFWLASAEGEGILYVNPAFEQLWGRPCADLYANPKLWLEMIHPDDTSRVVEALRGLEQGRVYDIEYRIRRPDGATRWINDRGYALRDSSGRVTRTCGVAADISERKRAERALEDEYTRRRVLFEQSPDGIVVVDPETGRFVEFNRAAHEQLGYSREEFAALRLADIVVGKSWEQIRAVIDAVRREGRADFESLHRTKQGDTKIVRVTAQIAEILGRPLQHAVWRDVTARRLAEAELRKLSRAVEQSPVSIMIANPAGEIEYVNPKFTELTGYSLEEVRGKNPRFLKSGETPAEDYRRLWSTITRGGEWRGEFHNKKKNGELFWEFASISAIVDEAGRISHFLAVKEDITERKQSEETLRRQASLFDQTYDAILAWDLNGPLTFWNRGAERVYGFSREEALGKPPGTLLHTVTRDGSGDFLPSLERDAHWEGELEQVTRDGRRIRLESRMVLVREAGRACVLEVNRDITERQLLEEQLRQAQKMEAIGRLAGGVAHDFNNLLGVIIGYTTLLEDATEDAALRKKLSEIHKAGQRAAELTRQLLAFSRKQVLEPRVVNLNSLIADMEKMLRRLIGEDVHLATALDASLGQVRVDPGQIEQVIMNLAVNARDALPHGGKLTIETHNAELDEVYARQHVGVRPGSYVAIAVSDNGIGMDQETQAHIFEPFFTTKKEGTGLGLATVYGIVKQSGGNIWVYSEPGKGTTFKIYLPRMDQPAEKSQNGSSAVHFPGGTETILIVEDAEPVRAIAREFLELGGYTVLSASSGTEALEIATHRDTPIHLLLTDVIMPEMSGPQLAEKLRALRGETKVLFMSGYTDAALAQHGVLENGKLLIMKPFSRETLTQKVREALSAA